MIITKKISPIKFKNLLTSFDLDLNYIWSDSEKNEGQLQFKTTFFMHNELNKKKKVILFICFVSTI